MGLQISVLLSVRDGETYIKKTIESVLSQTFEDFELLIIDDCSKDNTLKIISSFSDNRIKIFKNDKNLGLTKSLNKLIQEAKGNFIARIDADDLYYPDKLNLQFDFLKNKETGAVSSCCEIVDENENELHSLCPSSNVLNLKWSLIFRNNIRHSTMMWRKELNQEYNENFLYAQDYELWCRMIRKGIDIGIIHQKTVKIMHHDGSISNKNMTSQENYACMVTKRQVEFYLNHKISHLDIMNLRLLCAQKCSYQFKQFDKISKYDFKKAVNLYLDVSEAFLKKEKIEKQELINQINSDLSALLSGDKKTHTLIEIFKWVKNKNENEFIHLIEQNFLKIKEQENWNKNIKFI